MLSFEQRKDIVQSVTQRDRRSDFYRAHFGLTSPDEHLSVNTENEWRSLRPVTKDDLLASPLHRRSFLPLTELDHVRASSGTSGKGVLFSPRTHVRSLEYRLNFHDFAGAFMTYTVPMMPHWHETVYEAHGRIPRVLSYDPKEPEASARIARAANVDGLSLFVYHVRDAGEAFKKYGLHEHIRFLEITGELCSKTLFSYMRTTFPRATIVQSYGASEVEDVHIGIPCRPMTGEEPLALFHEKETHYLEIIDPESGQVLEPHEGTEGELLITAYPGEPSAFPLIRFRIGDTVRVHAPSCEHGRLAFSVVGRSALDFLKMPGGILRADEIERILRLMPTDVSDEFQAHRYEHMTPYGPKPQITIAVQRKKQTDLESLAHTISSLLRVNPERTYADGVREGRYLPLICTDLDTDRTGNKHRRLIAHQ